MGAQNVSSMEQNNTNTEPPGWFEPLARFGYGVKGIVYLLVGVLATMVVLGIGGETTGTSGVLQNIAQQPFGTILLSIVAAGLICYTLWRFVQAGVDPEHKGNDASGLLNRLGYAISGVAYAGLAFTALQILFTSGGGGGNSTESWTARLLSQPFGPWLVGAVGAAIIGVGGYQVYRGVSASFRKNVKLGHMSDTEETLVMSLGRFGLAARGLVLGIIGFFLIQAAWQFDSDEARGLGQTLQEIVQQPFGPLLLGIVAVGLIAYGLFMMLMGRYRKINVDS